MGRFPFHGEQPNGPPFPHHPDDIGGLPMPDMPQVLATSQPRADFNASHSTFQNNWWISHCVLMPCAMPAIA